jgi:hypothetical protein
LDGGYRLWIQPVDATDWLNRPECAADVLSDICRPAIFDPVGQFHDGGFEGEMVFVDLDE